MDQNNEGGMNTNQNAPVGEAPVAPVSAGASAPASDGVSEHKLWAIVGYILPFLFFIPMLDEKSKHNAFARFHANQQLTLLGICVILYVLSNVFYMVLAMGAFILMPLINLALIVLVVMGVIHAAQGEMKELPIVGGFNFLDKVFK